MFEELLYGEEDPTAGMTREEEGEFEYGHIIRLGEARKSRKKNKAIHNAISLGVLIIIVMLMGLFFGWTGKY